MDHERSLEILEHSRSHVVAHFTFGNVLMYTAFVPTSICIFKSSKWQLRWWVTKKNIQCRNTKTSFWIVRYSKSLKLEVVTFLFSYLDMKKKNGTMIQVYYGSYLGWTNAWNCSMNRLNSKWDDASMWPHKFQCGHWLVNCGGVHNDRYSLIGVTVYTCVETTWFKILITHHVYLCLSTGGISFSRFVTSLKCQQIVWNFSILTNKHQKEPNRIAYWEFLRYRKKI